MNIFEFLFFLLVTATVGAIVGVIVSLFTGGLARGAEVGAFVGPIVAASGITIYLFISKIRKARAQKVTSKNDENT